MRHAVCCVLFPLHLLAACPQTLMLDDPLPEIDIYEADLSDVLTFVAISSRCFGTKVALSADVISNKIVYVVNVIRGDTNIISKLPQTDVRVTIRQEAGKSMHDFCRTLAKTYDMEYISSATNLIFFVNRPAINVDDGIEFHAHLHEGSSKSHNIISQDMDEANHRKLFHSNTHAISSVAPKLSFPPEGIALGEFAAGEPVSGAAELRNTGDTPLRIAGVRGCCGMGAELSALSIPPGGSATLTVSLRPQPPGPVSNAVRVRCNDPTNPSASIPVTGTAVAGGTVPAASSRFTLPAVLAAGLADGVNPCAFSAAIMLASVLALGGRRRRSRLAGGLAFCLGSFLTYMAMGLGLLRALRALEPLRAARGAVTAVLALSLFALAFLSFRDALRFRRTGSAGSVALRLPARLKRAVAAASARMRGPSVFTAGLGCGFLVTLIDAVCTGQIYVPVLALIAREPGAWRSLGLLAAYNLAFVAPLAAVFAAAAKGADAAAMSGWAKRNVVPAKIAMGAVFALLGILLLAAAR